MSIDWTQVIIALIGVVFTGVLIPAVKCGIEYMKAKMSKEQLEQLDYWSNKLVVVAEIIFDGFAQGQDKKEWVIQQLIDRGIITEKDTESVSTLIDSIVEELTAKSLINTNSKTRGISDQKPIDEE